MSEDIGGEGGVLYPEGLMSGGGGGGWLGLSLQGFKKQGLMTTEA